MKAHTTSFKEEIKKMGREIDSIITIDGKALGKDDLNAITPSFQGTLLKSVMKQLDIDTNVEIPVGTILNYKFGVKVNDTFEYVDFGNYIVKEVEKQEDTGSYKLTCYDKILYSMVDYTTLKNGTFPMSIKEYEKNLCLDLGLEFKNYNDEFANNDKILEKDPYENLGFTYRDIFDQLAQVTASTICLDNEDKVENREIGPNKNLAEVIINAENNSITNATSDFIQNFVVEGNSKQETSTQQDGDNIFDFQQWHKKISAGDMTISYGRGSGFILNNNGFSTRNVPTATDSWVSLNAIVDGVLEGWSYTSTGISDAKKQVAKKFTLSAEASTEYTLSCDVSFDTTLTGDLIKTELYAFLYDENFDYLGLRNIQFKNKFEANVSQRLSLTFSTNATTKYIFWRVDNESYNTIPANMTVANIAIKKGTDAIYTEYVPNSPSPDYPSEIKTVKGIENLYPELSSVKDGWVNGSLWNLTGEYYKGMPIVSTTTQWYGLHRSDIGLKPNTYYTLSCYARSSDGATLASYSWNTSPENKGFGKLTTEFKRYSYTFLTLSSSANGIRFEQSSSGTTIEICGLQLEEGKIEHPNVPYGSRYLINEITGKNKFDGLIEIGGYNVNTGQLVANNNQLRNKNIIKVEPNTTYTFSLSSSKITEQPRYFFYDKDKNFLSSIVPTDGSRIETPDNCYYLNWHSSALKTNYGTALSNPMIAKGQETNYEPYKENIIIYGLKKENLFNKDGGFEKGYLDATGNFVTNNNVALFDYIPIKANTKYTMSLNERLEYRFAYYDNNKTFISRSDAFFGSSSFKTPENTQYLKMFINVLQTVTQEIIDGLDIKIYEGTGTDDYYELASIGDVKDELDEVSGVLTKRIGKVVLNGSENWIKSGGTTSTMFVGALDITNIMITKTYNGLSNYFIYKSNAFDIGKFQLYNTNTDKTIKNMAFAIDITEVPDLATFKTWLSNNPVTVYYVLAEPETIQLKKEIIRTFDGVNNFTMYNGIDTNLKINYSTDFDTIDEEYLKDININFGEKYGPINSIVLSRSGGSDRIYLQDEVSIEQDGLYEFVIEDNEIMNFNDRDIYLPDILNKLKGTEFYLNDFSSTGICYLDLCDRYNVSIDNKKYGCIMFNSEINVTQGLEEIVYTELPEESKTDYKKADKTDRKVNQAYIIVDKQSQEITSAVSKVEDSEQRMDNLDTSVNELKTNLNTIKTSIETIESTILQQTEDQFNMWFSNTGLNETINAIKNGLDNVDKDTTMILEYIQFKGAEITLGKTDSQCKVIITNERISFMTGDNESAFIDNNQLYINDSTILNKMQIGKWETKPDALDNLNTRWIG